MSHYLGAVFKYLAAAAIFVFSVSLSYTYFSAIAPSNMPWFTWAALGLTEIGFICWLAVFMLQHHHDAHKTIAFLMVWICLAAVLFTDAVELAHMFGTTFFLAQFYYYGLIVLLLAHFLSFAMDFFVSYFEKVSFHGGNLIPTNGRYHRPLASRNQPKDATMESVSLGQTATVPQLPESTQEEEMQEETGPTLREVLTAAKDTVKSGVSSATKRVSRSKKRMKKVPARARGKVSAITEESISTDNRGESEEGQL